MGHWTQQCCDPMSRSNRSLPRIKRALENSKFAVQELHAIGWIFVVDENRLWWCDRAAIQSFGALRTLASKS